MTEQRKQQITDNLQNIVASFTPTDEYKELTMFGLISSYNATGDNAELIGGDWVLENTVIKLTE